MAHASSLPLREAVPADIPALVTLVNGAYRGESAKVGWTHEADLLGGTRTDAERMVALVGRHDAALLVHEDGGAPVACVLVERLQGGGAYLGMLTVKPALQASGVGQRLLAGAEEYVRSKWQARTVEMTVIPVRSELVAWYERRGYVLTGERRPFPADDTIELLHGDVELVVLRKELSRE
jgi:ribosomal protein S18 acetylase RimI-like enzyme